MQTQDLKLFNKVLTEANNQDDSFVSKEQNDDGYWVWVYKTHIPEVFIKVIWEDDSYGGEDRLISIEFVKATQKVVLDYQPL